MSDDFESYFTFPGQQVKAIAWLETKWEVSPSNTTQLKQWEEVYEANAMTKPVRPHKAEWYGVKSTNDRKPKDKY